MSHARAILAAAALTLAACGSPSASTETTAAQDGYANTTPESVPTEEGARAADEVAAPEPAP